MTRPTFRRAGKVERDGEPGQAAADDEDVDRRSRGGSWRRGAIRARPELFARLGVCWP